VAIVVDGPALGWAVVLPQLVAGAGSGLTITPNQTLTLSEVPIAGGGSAAGVIQTGQRIGTALGIAFTGTIFFGLVAGSTSYPRALAVSMLVVAGFMTLALAIALTDVRLGRRDGPTGVA